MESVGVICMVLPDILIPIPITHTLQYGHHPFRRPQVASTWAASTWWPSTGEAREVEAWSSCRICSFLLRHDSLHKWYSHCFNMFHYLAAFVFMFESTFSYLWLAGLCMPHPLQPDIIWALVSHPFQHVCRIHSKHAHLKAIMLVFVSSCSHDFIWHHSCSAGLKFWVVAFHVHISIVYTHDIPSV